MRFKLDKHIKIDIEIQDHTLVGIVWIVAVLVLGVTYGILY